MVWTNSLGRTRAFSKLEVRNEKPNSLIRTGRFNAQLYTDEMTVKLLLITPHSSSFNLFKSKQPVLRRLCIPSLFFFIIPSSKKRNMVTSTSTASSSDSSSSSSSSSFYTTITETITFEREIKKSKFIAIAGSITDDQSGHSFLSQVKDSRATHNCWAYKVGDQYRSNDDGEPSGTAGKPIYTAIASSGIDRIMVVVIRYFGGIKLGTGGLVRAYGGVASECLKNATTCLVKSKISIAMEVPYDLLGVVYHQVEHSLSPSQHDTGNSSPPSTNRQEIPDNMSLPSEPNFGSLKVDYDVSKIRRTRPKQKVLKQPSTSDGARKGDSEIPTGFSTPTANSRKHTRHDTAEGSGKNKTGQQAKDFVGDFHFGGDKITEDDSAIKDPKVVFSLMHGAILPLDREESKKISDKEINRSYYHALAQVQILGVERTIRQNVILEEYKKLKAAFDVGSVINLKEKIKLVEDDGEKKNREHLEALQARDQEIAHLKVNLKTMDDAVVDLRVQLTTKDSALSSKEAELDALKKQYQNFLELSNQVVLDKVKAEVDCIVAEMNEDDGDDDEVDRDDTVPMDTANDDGDQADL